MSQKDAGPSTELVAIVMFFAGFALGVEAERTQVSPADPAPVAAVAQATPAAAQHFAVRGTTSLMQMGGSFIP